MVFLPPRQRHLIPFDELPLEVARVVSDWPRTDRGILAGVSSFGFGGTNAHAVLGGAPAAPPAADAGSGPARSVLPISARSWKHRRYWIDRPGDEHRHPHESAGEGFAESVASEAIAPGNATSGDGQGKQMTASPGQRPSPGPPGLNAAAFRSAPPQQRRPSSNNICTSELPDRWDLLPARWTSTSP